MSEDELARTAYEAWRAEAGCPQLPCWERASAVTREAWTNRVGSYLEFRWDSLGDHGTVDRYVRTACQKHGGLE